MTKPSSTNSRNVRRLVADCPMTYAFTLLGKRWKPIILWKIHEGCRTPATLRRSIPLVSRKMLFQALRELVEDGLAVKGAAAGAPNYRLTRRGSGLLPALSRMLAWGRRNRPPRQAVTFL
jgi:DNA-binding HxlR family transcriptional regulator